MHAHTVSAWEITDGKQHVDLVGVIPLAALLSIKECIDKLTLTQRQFHIWHKYVTTLAYSIHVDQMHLNFM